MAYLVDTNVLSELRKGSRAVQSVRAWRQTARSEETFVSVLALGELRYGIELLRRNDWQSADHLERWLDGIKRQFHTRILPVTLEVADLWGRLSPSQPLPVADALMAATAMVHDLTLVTRNTRDFERSGVRLLNPFVG